MTKSGIFTCTVLGIAGLALGAPSVALAYYEKVNGPVTYAQCGSCHGVGMPNPADPDDRPGCQHCHGYNTLNFPLGQYNSVDVLTGPHGNYITTSSRCDSCHQVHDSTGERLLPGATIVDTCLTCHDGTGGFGVYGAIKARSGRDPATDLSFGSHRIATTDLIPGGDAVSGGGAARTFVGPAGLLTCSDCHSVHASNTVRPFMGERKRTRSHERQDRPTSKLLRTRPTGGLADVVDYGSDWCASCHAGRVSGHSVMNHPVDSFATRPDPFVFRSVAGGRQLAYGTTIESFSMEHSSPGKALFGVGNRDFLIAEPRLAAQGTHAPICQQCHEDTREVGDLRPDGSLSPTNTYSLRMADGLGPTDSPAFQNFPHETVNDKMVIETGDDLCQNCHVP